ncbi:unnamed protein product [Bursaphelenchus xylophilus]|uniref:(pine wood nematode) hypothetical protein n=1 Tax=Bursaphelenchus xylophilus TaxID=6326 RepID=A0A1I7RQ91_BURXY|nr:unnamed protein product [Bursaphelenchus xylophilus]CAG9097333.1 unnamed protein product [Bursaphelenchus xylophilus]
MALLLEIFLFTVFNILHGCRVNPETAFRSCSCNEINKGSVEIKCSNQDWDRIPSLQRIIPLDDRSSIKLGTLIIERSSLSTIPSDNFRNQSINSLILSNNRISTLNVNAFRGLEDSLQELNLQNNQITVFPFWAFTFLRNLVSLKLQDNHINDLGDAISKENQMKNLRVLHLDRNNITKIGLNSLSGFPINVLTLSENQIRSVDPNSLPLSLAVLDLSQNLIAEIPLIALKELQLLSELDLHENSIKEIKSNPEVEFKNDIKINLANNLISKLNHGDFSSFQRISELDIAMNKVSYVNERAFEGVKKLEKLSLAFNQIENLQKNTFGSLAKTLRRLNLGYNEFEEVPVALEPLLSLESLELNNNKLKRINHSAIVNFKHTLKSLRLDFNNLLEVESEIFDGMQRLEILDISNNQIQNLGRMAFGNTNGAAGSLRELNLAGNKLEHLTDAGIFLYFTSLQYLNLSFNKLKNITSDTLGRLSALKVIDLRNNQLGAYPKTALYNLKQLRSVQLSRNWIKELPVRLLEHNREVTELHLKGNRLQVINDQTFHKSTSQNLKWLDLSHNLIQEVGTDAFEGLSTLSHLDLSSNKLLHLNPQTFNQLNEIKSINLENNNIKVIHDFAFNQLPLLVYLNLGFNQLDKLSENSFQNIPNLEKLSVSHNNFKNFDFNFMNNNVHKLKVLDLSYNKLSKLDLTSLQHSIHHLSLKHNDFEFIDNRLLSTSSQLKTLDLSLNSIIEIHVDAFQKATDLRNIYLFGNRLSTLWRETFANQKKIEILDVSHNFITNVETGVFGRNNVINLKLAHNHLSSTPTKALSPILGSLLHLDLSHNSIRSIEKNDFLESAALETLNLANNKIEVIEANAFSQLKRLKTLDLSGNQITTWNPSAFNKISIFLEELNLASTGLFSMPRIPVKNLIYLNLSSNKIYDVQESELENIRNLRVLDISRNNLKALPNSFSSKLHNLKTLNLSQNPLKKFEEDFFMPLNRLQSLELCELDQLQYLPAPKEFSYLTKLQNLQIFGIPQSVNYNMTSILMNLPPLRSLHIQINSHTLDNQLAEVDSRLLNQLMITGPSLRMINSQLLSKIKRFRLHLIIRNTSLSYMPPNFFRHLKGIRYLMLSLPNNQIETMEDLFKHGAPPVLNEYGTILEYLDLTENPLICDCRMKYLNEWISYAREEIPSWPQTRDSLSHAKCSNQANGVDNLLNLYDITNMEYAKNLREKEDQTSAKDKMTFIQKVSPRMQCQDNNEENKFLLFFSCSCHLQLTYLISVSLFLFLF